MDSVVAWRVCRSRRRVWADRASSALSILLNQEMHEEAVGLRKPKQNKTNIKKKFMKHFRIVMSSVYSSTIKVTNSNSFASPSLHSLAAFSSESRNLVSLKKSLFPGKSIFVGKRNLCTISAASKWENDSTLYSSSQGAGGQSFFRSVLASMERVYLDRNPTAKSVLELVLSADGEAIAYDHLAFRTFGLSGHGIDSLASFFLGYGYTQQEELRFPVKKIKALWFSPPHTPFAEGGSGVNGPLPRIFISELLVEQLSSQAQEIIKKYIKLSGSGYNHAALASSLGSLTWEKPLYSEFQQLASESEYAAWTLVNGYALNHVTISTHRLKSHLKNIKSLNQFIEEKGFKLNSEGGVLKVSPDGLLLQSSTVADSISFKFSEDVTESVPCSYIEFAERLVLPQYKNLRDEEIKEFHRRDGFEVGNADKIFESTYKEQLTRRGT